MTNTCDGMRYQLWDGVHLPRERVVVVPRWTPQVDFDRRHGGADSRHRIDSTV
jgi:hypothetical protein